MFWMAAIALGGVTLGLVACLVTALVFKVWGSDES